MSSATMKPRGLFDFSENDIRRYRFTLKYVVPVFISAAYIYAISFDAHFLAVTLLLGSMLILMLRLFIQFKQGSILLEEKSTRLPFFKWLQKRFPKSPAEICWRIASAGVTLLSLVPASILLPLITYFQPTQSISTLSLNYYFPRLLAITSTAFTATLLAASGAHKAFSQFESFLFWSWIFLPTLAMLVVALRGSEFVASSLRTKWRPLYYMPAVLLLLSLGIFMSNFLLRIELGVEPKISPTESFVSRFFDFVGLAIGALADLPSLLKIVTDELPAALRRELDYGEIARFHLAGMLALFGGAVFGVALASVRTARDPYSTRVIGYTLANAEQYDEALALIDRLPDSAIEKHYELAGILGLMGRYSEREREIITYCKRYHFRIYDTHPSALAIITERSITRFYKIHKGKYVEYAEHQGRLAADPELILCQAMLHWFHLAAENTDGELNVCAIQARAVFRGGDCEEFPLPKAFVAALYGCPMALLELSSEIASNGASAKTLSAMAVGLCFARASSTAHRKAIDDAIFVIANRIISVSDGVTDGVEARLLSDALLIVENTDKANRMPEVSEKRKLLWKVWLGIAQ